MVDVWWGLCEPDGPGQYVFDGYVRLAGICMDIGLKIQAVMSFHQCGGNVGDTCVIPLPQWVLKLGDLMPDVFFKDSAGVLNKEVLCVRPTRRCLKALPHSFGRVFVRMHAHALHLHYLLFPLHQTLCERFILMYIFA